jgi:hypothetical protein
MRRWNLAGLAGTHSGEIMKTSTWAGTLFAAVLVQLPGAIYAEPWMLQMGAYEITVRLELPHVERWAIDQTMRICLPGLRGGGEIPIPVLSANSPFAKCSAEDLAIDGTNLRYEIVCPGRGAAKAHATYTLAPNRFTGHVAMVMGAKNMTMTEVQRAERVGECGPILSESGVRDSEVGEPRRTD